MVTFKSQPAHQIVRYSSSEELVSACIRKGWLLLDASPVDLENGGAGLTCSRVALERGASVVFANKSPVNDQFSLFHAYASSHL